ncbi:MAG: hypothetical protein P9M14_04785 [Candidatus Alcyoniella australis]|nr:hypothetical protein [Candidatus Alcyoniella australis]
MRQSRPPIVLLLALAALLLCAPYVAADDDPLPYPFKVGARWDYDVLVPAVGKVGSGSRYIEPRGMMMIQMDVRTSEKCGTYYYHLLPTPTTLEVDRAGFIPSKDGEPFEIIIDPPFPFFVNPEHHGPVDVRKTCRALSPSGELLGQGPATFAIIERNVQLNDYPELYVTLLDQQFHRGIAQRSIVWMNPELGIVRAKVKLNFLISVTWELTKFTPPPGGITPQHNPPQ